MKLDLKSILILVLLLTTLIFGYKWFYSNSSASNERVKQLELEFKELEKKKLANNLEIDSLKNAFNLLKLEDARLKEERVKLENEARLAEITAAQSKEKLAKLRAELAETRRKIEEFKKNPPNRTGDILIQSLKNKTQ